MSTTVGVVAALFRYPVKSCAGESLSSAHLGWHGLEGDRRLAFRKLDDAGGFPWLTASRLPELVRFVPRRSMEAELPTHLQTPDGQVLELFGSELAAEMSRRHGSAVQMMHLSRGIFDEASVSIIAESTVQEVGRLAGQRPEVRRFRPNILIRTLDAAPFNEERWIGGVLRIGEGAGAAAITVTNHDERCVMVNLDPDTAERTPEVLKAIVHARQNRAGVYGAVLRRGPLAVGQTVSFSDTT